MCFVSSTELKKNLSYYLKKSEQEDIYVTKNKKVIAVISNPGKSSFDIFMSLQGFLKEFDDGRDYKDIIGEEIIKRTNCN